MTTKIIPAGNDPETVQRLAEAYGASTKYVSFHDIFSLDIDLLAYLPHPIYSITFLFPVGPKNGYIEQRKYHMSPPKGEWPFFTHQYYGDLCGTIAMIHNITNNFEHMPIKPGSWIDNFFRDTKNKTPEERGRILEHATELFAIHNAQATESTEPLLDEKVDTHYCAFIQKDGIVWELDGRSPYPVCHGEVTDFAVDVINVIQREFVSHMTEEDALRISLTAMCRKEEE